MSEIVKKLSKAAQDVLAERRRQIEKEGWTEQHDDDHADGALAAAAACYAFAATADSDERKQIKNIEGPYTPAFFLRQMWPSDWLYCWWKPKNKRRDLVRAGALILAEIERLDRQEA